MPSAVLCCVVVNVFGWLFFDVGVCARGPRRPSCRLWGGRERERGSGYGLCYGL